MGKVIDLPARTAPVRWTIQVGDCDDFIQCRYVTESVTMSAPHWKVFIMASTVDHVQMLIEKAKGQMAIHNKAVRAAAAGRRHRNAQVGCNPAGSPKLQP